MAIMKKWLAANGSEPPVAIAIDIFNPEELEDRKVATVWWKKDQIESRTAVIQKEVFTSPRPTAKHKLSATELGEQIITKADRLTAEIYARAESDVERVGILLLGAYIGRYNRHTQIAPGLPPESEALRVRRDIERMVGHLRPDYGKRAISGIPVAQPAPSFKADQKSLIDLLIKDTVALLADCSIVTIRSVSEPTPAARAIIEEERLRIERQEREAQQARNQHAQLDPSKVVWRDSTAAHLLSLVWSNPVSTVAKTLGISSASLAQVLKNNGIPSPGHGFWAQVKAGKRPHPDGHPDFSPNHEYEGNKPNKARRYERIREDKRNFGRKTTMNRPGRSISNQRDSISTRSDMEEKGAER